MLTTLIKASWKPLILIALVSLTITWVFNIQNTLITTETINGMQIKIFNAQTYLQNLNNAWQTNALNFQDILPQRSFENTGNFLQDISNNLLAVFDWLYFPINFILWLLRWLAWLITILLAIIGWNTGYIIQNDTKIYYSQLVEILNWVTENLMIPYV